MNIQELSKYKVTFIKTKTGMTIFGQAKEVVDEGRLFRIAELHVIWKPDVAGVWKEKDTFILEYKNGESITIGIVNS